MKGEEGDKNSFDSEEGGGVREIALGEGAKSAEATDKKGGSCQGSAQKSLGVGLAWKKKDERGGPACHGEIGEGGDDGKMGATTKAEFERPRTERVKKRGEKGEGQRHKAECTQYSSWPSRRRSCAWTVGWLGQRGDP